MVSIGTKIYAGDYRGEKYYWYGTDRVKNGSRYQYVGYFDNENYDGKQVPFSFVAENIPDLKRRIANARKKFPAMMEDAY